MSLSSASVLCVTLTLRLVTPSHVEMTSENMSLLKHTVEVVVVALVLALKEVTILLCKATADAGDP